VHLGGGGFVAHHDFQRRRRRMAQEVDLVRLVHGEVVVLAGELDDDLLEVDRKCSRVRLIPRIDDLLIR